MESISPERRARQVLIWLGAAEQRLATRVNRALAETGLPYAQFAVLSHLASLPGKPWTVSALAAALEAGQPGVSKILQRLSVKGLVDTEPDPRDGRVRRVRLTAEGRDAFRRAAGRVAPLAEAAFAGWEARDIETLHGLLYRLKTSLRD